MIAAAAILWLTLDASVERLYMYPGYQPGAGVRGGFQLAHELRPRLSISLIGRAGATYADDWRPVFEASAALSWRDALEVHGGLRHDERLRREGALASFRDPTGRAFVGVSVLPIRKGLFSAGASIDYEHALPGEGRLPSSVSLAAVARVRWRFMAR